jgi:hypothetical protein
MALKICRSVISCLALMSLATSCFAQTATPWTGPMPPHAALPDCPSLQNDHKWQDYFQGHYQGNRGVKYFSIYFDKMEGKSDVGWGELRKGQCLRGIFQIPTDGIGVLRAISVLRNGKRHGGDVRRGADLSKNQINVWGHIFTFDSDTGELFDEKLGLVGHLECTQTC